MRRPINELKLEQFLASYPRIAGAEDPPEPEPGNDPKPEPGADPSKPEPKPKDVPDEPETVSMPKAEVDALRRKVAEAEKQKRQADREAREREEERQRQQGEYQQLAEAKAREAEELRNQLEKAEQSRRVARLAQKLKFRDPDDVIGRLTSEEAADDVLAENALERIAEQKPYLLEQAEKPKPEIGRVLDPSADPSDGKPGSTRPKDAAYYERLSQKELADLPDEEFKRALKLLKAAGKL